MSATSSAPHFNRLMTFWFPPADTRPLKPLKILSSAMTSKASSWDSTSEHISKPLAPHMIIFNKRHHAGKSSCTRQNVNLNRFPSKQRQLFVKTRQVFFDVRIFFRRFKRIWSVIRRLFQIFKSVIVSTSKVVPGDHIHLNTSSQNSVQGPLWF